jgi:uncharacterized repeat protein (TIGR01451 family)
VTAFPGGDLARQAAALAVSVVGADYRWGGKGWDYDSKSFVSPATIKTGGYRYYNPDLVRTDGKKGGLDFNDGLDCSGLIFWAYNRAHGATGFQEPTNPVYWEGADGQRRNNFTQTVLPQAVLPGDVLFFDNNADGFIDHVAMFVGGNPFDVVEAANPNQGIKFSRKSDLQDRSDFVGFYRRTPPQIPGRIQTKSPISLIVKDPEGLTITTDTLIVTPQERLREVPGQLYYSLWDANKDGSNDDLVSLGLLKPGEYTIQVVPKPGASPMETYGITIEVGAQTIALAERTEIRSIPKDGYRVQSQGGVLTYSPPDLAVTTSVEEPGPYRAGQTVHFVSVVRNQGGHMSSASRVLFMDRLPAGTVFRNAAGDGATCSWTAPDVACEHSSLASGEQFSIRIEVELPTRVPGGGPSLNQVEVDPKNAVSETSETNNKAQLSLTVS